MIPDLDAAVDILDSAVARAAGLVDRGLVEDAAVRTRMVRQRAGFLGETVVAALAGGTGSGKSSLLNALADAKVAPTGPLRPTTDEPLALLPANPEPGLVRLLDDLGIEQRVEQESMSLMAVIDLPDFDSVDPGHVLSVQRLVPRVDAVIWVLDPEKYADAAVHKTWLAPLARYSATFLFVLNQVDRLPVSARDEVVADLCERLAADGIEEPVVLTTAADPATGPPEGIDELRRLLDDRVAGKQTAVSKMLADIRRTSAELAEVTGVTTGGLDLDRRWSDCRDRAAALSSAAMVDMSVIDAAQRDGVRIALATGSGPIGRLAHRFRRSAAGRALGSKPDEAAAAVGQRAAAGAGLPAAAVLLEELVGDLSFEAGGAFGEHLRGEFSPPRVEGELEAAADAVRTRHRSGPVVARSGWWPVAAVVQTLLLLALIGAGLWAWAQPDVLRPGNWPWPLIAAFGVILVGSLVAAMVRSSGRRAGQHAADHYRSEVKADLSGEIDRRLGLPLRAIARDRAELAGMLTELGAATAKVEAKSW
jgi:hypothetical protein